MSYTRTITSNGNSISQEGGQSFNQQLDDLQEQIEEGGGGSITDLGTSSGTANALAGASLVDTATTFTAGRLYRIRTNAANSGAATCSINGGTGVAMKKSPSSAALASGDIADATELLLYYDGTNLQVLSGMTVSADEMILAVPTTTRSSNAFSGDLPVAPASLATGLIIAWRVPSAPSGASTYNLNSLGAKDIYRGNAAAVAADLPANRDILMRYDGTQWQIVGFGTLTKLDMPFTGTPDGSKYLRDDQTWQAVSATDSTKLPLAGGTMSGALKMSGTVNIDAASMEMYPAGSGLLYRNVPTGGLYGECVNGAEVYQLGASGIAFPYAHSTPGTNVVGVYRDGSGNLCLGVGSGAGLIAKVAGSRAGGFPLTPSDMPSQVAKYSRTTSNQGSLSGSYVANTVGLNSVDSNIGTNWSFSGGVATCLNAGVYDLVAQLGYSSQEGGFVINHNGNAIGIYYYFSGNSLLFGSINIPEVSVGAGDTIKLEFFSSAAAGVIYYTYAGFSTTVPDKHATWLRMTRRQ